MVVTIVVVDVVVVVAVVVVVRLKCDQSDRLDKENLSGHCSSQNIFATDYHLFHDIFRCDH